MKEFSLDLISHDHLEMCGLTFDSPLIEAKMLYMWGTYGPAGNEQLKWVRLCDCDSTHLKSILCEQNRLGCVKAIIYDILSGRGVDLNYTKDYVFSIQCIDYFVCIDDHGVNHHSKRYFAVAKIGDQILVNDTNFNGSHMHSVNGEISVITDLDRAISSTRGLIGRVKNCGHMDERYWSQLTTELEMVEDMV